MRYWLFHYIFSNMGIYILNFLLNFHCVIIHWSIDIRIDSFLEKVLNVDIFYETSHEFCLNVTRALASDYFSPSFDTWRLIVKCSCKMVCIAGWQRNNEEQSKPTSRWQTPGFLVSFTTVALTFSTRGTRPWAVTFPERWPSTQTAFYLLSATASCLSLDPLAMYQVTHFCFGFLVTSSLGFKARVDI